MFLVLKVNEKEFCKIMSDFLNQIEAKIATIMSSSGAHAPNDTTAKLVEAISEHVAAMQGQLDTALFQIAELQKVDTDIVDKLQDPVPDSSPPDAAVDAAPDAAA